MGDSLYYGHGGLAEYVALTERVPLIAMPEGLSFELAAALPQAAILALQGLSRVRPTAPGDRVLVNGAGGGGGTFAIQMAKHLGAEVTAVDHAWKQEMMRSIGADHVIDHLIDNYPKRGPFDRILDFVGSRSLRANRKALARDGVYSLVGGPVRRLLGASTLGWIGSKAGSKHLGVLIAKPNREDLGAITRLVVEGTVTPVIHRTYALQEVPEALAELGANRVLGKAVIVP
jgi:NADPH:quinone reductase-like Zn-dependent oxidoreductase